jgi:hypothetical protein
MLYIEFIIVSYDSSEIKNYTQNIYAFEFLMHFLYCEIEWTRRERPHLPHVKSN